MVTCMVLVFREVRGAQSTVVVLAQRSPESSEKVFMKASKGGWYETNHIHLQLPISIATTHHARTTDPPTRSPVSMELVGGVRVAWRCWC